MAEPERGRPAVRPTSPYWGEATGFSCARSLMASCVEAVRQSGGGRNSFGARLLWRCRGFGDVEGDLLVADGDGFAIAAGWCEACGFERTKRGGVELCVAG